MYLFPSLQSTFTSFDTTGLSLIFGSQPGFSFSSLSFSGAPAHLLLYQYLSPPSSINWIGFLILDIGIPDLEAIPLGTRIAVGFLQTIAVRCAGFAAVGVASLAPAVL